MNANEKLKNQFDQDGFIHIQGFLSPTESDALEDNLQRVIRDVAPTLPKTQVMYEDYRNPLTLKQITGLHACDPFFSQVLSSPKLVNLAQALLADACVPQNLQLFCKPPGFGTPTPAHQDGYYFCLVPNEALTVWLPLDDIDRENGALRYFPESHKKGLMPHAASGVLGFSQGLASAPSEWGEETICEVKRGDCLVHHCLTIHAADGNRSMRRRRVIGLVYYAQRAKLDPAARQRYLASLKEQQKEKGII